MTTISKKDWQNLQADLAAALERAEAAEASELLWRSEAKAATSLKSENDALRKRVHELEAVREHNKPLDELMDNNAALLGRLSDAHKENQRLLQKPRKKDEAAPLIKRLKKRIRALEGEEPRAKRGGNGS